eukprot:CAMPEP_0114299808 /NCGR_PEP_ID=MMETSP0059-20121206/13184_1 /TAXON_ID=36894 /ORGANISM="Pyramimonas parkeae, Strain CCMP726" /LENGTH=245 /DNA_ID=CAMNT_0001422331 /DNA_START=2492 /DNA_END=3226 /DNA_ORIENTATION=+
MDPTSALTPIAITLQRASGSLDGDKESFMLMDDVSHKAMTNDLISEAAQCESHAQASIQATEGFVYNKCFVTKPRVHPATVTMHATLQPVAASGDLSTSSETVMAAAHDLGCASSIAMNINLSSPVTSGTTSALPNSRRQYDAYETGTFNKDLLVDMSSTAADVQALSGEDPKWCGGTPHVSKKGGSCCDKEERKAIVNQVETDTEKQPSKPEPCNRNDCAANILDRNELVEWDGCCSCSRKAKC